MTASAPGSWRYLAQVLALATLYFVTGRCALLLAIPPGYATPVWPAAGVALAAMLTMGRRVWPSILVGSFLVNVSTSFDSGTTAALIRSLLVPVGIGAGAALQATVGFWLVRRFAPYPNPLEEEWYVIRFLLLAGPLSCLVAATVGVTSLLIAGVIPAANYGFSWWTWWVGDVIGVLTVTPLLLIWSPQQRRLGRRRRLAVTLPSIALMCVMVVVFLRASATDKERLRQEFLRRGDTLGDAVERRLAEHVEMMHSVANFLETAPTLDRDGFSRFATATLARHPGIYELSWNPLVPDHARRAFEEAARRDGLRRFAITERRPDGSVGPAGSRPEYFAVRFIEPPSGNDSDLGYDIASDPVRGEALQRARDTGLPSATSRVPLKLEIGSQGAVVLLVPVYAPGFASSDVVEQRARLRGFAGGVFPIGDLVAVALRGRGTGGLSMRLIDQTGAEPDPILFTNIEAGVEGPARDAGFHRDISFDFGGRRWLLEVVATQEYLVSQRSWQAWSVLAGGLAYTSLLGAFLLVVTGRTARVERLVTERAEANASLAASARALEQTVGDLARSNAELERFAYVASHDLQEPLRMVGSYTQLLKKRYAGRLDAEADEFIAFTLDGVAWMRQLIEDLLVYSRVNASQLQRQRVDLESVLARVIGNLHSSIEDTGATVTHDRLPTLSVDRSQVTQLLQNLIANALKFRRADPPRVHVAAEPHAGEWLFSVRDNGIGLSPSDSERIFEVFRRLHTRSDYAGTGIGLAICKRVVEGHGGRIWVDSREGSGSTFQFTLPARRGTEV